jgi:ribosomal protein S27AE
MAEVLRRSDEVDDPLGLDIRVDGRPDCPACGEGKLSRNDRLEFQCDRCGYIESADFAPSGSNPF